MILYIVLFIISLLPPFILYFFKPLYLKAIVQDLRLLRILHYIILVIIGGALFAKKTLFALPNSIIFFQFPLFFISLFYAAIFTIVTNNISDIVIDKISNPNRPLIQLTIPQGQYLQIGLFCFGIAILISFATSILMGFTILFIVTLYFIYSCKPFRFKKYLFISKLLIAINSLLVTVAGFMLAGGNWRNFPAFWIFYIIVPFSLASHFIDLKDVKGDAVDGIKTLPVVLGENKAKLLISVFTFLAYLLPVYYLNVFWMYPIALLGSIFHIWLLHKKPFNEKYIFLFYTLSLIILTTLIYNYTN